MTSGVLTWLVAAVEHLEPTSALEASAPQRLSRTGIVRFTRSGVSGRAAWLTLAALLSLAAVAFAAGEASRDKAERALASVKGDPKAAEVAKQPVAKAEKALERAADARKSGDTAHAAQLDALALEWAETSVDLARTAALESRAELAEKETAELEARAKRALSLIEQTVARRGRAREKLRELGVDPERTPEATAPTSPASTSPASTTPPASTGTSTQAPSQAPAPPQAPASTTPKKDGTP